MKKHWLSIAIIIVFGFFAYYLYQAIAGTLVATQQTLLSPFTWFANLIQSWFGGTVAASPDPNVVVNPPDVATSSDPSNPAYNIANFGQQ